MWGLDGFIVSLIVPIYSQRQIEVILECKPDEASMLFWLSDTFSAIKYSSLRRLLSISPPPTEDDVTFLLSPQVILYKFIIQIHDIY